MTTVGRKLLMALTGFGFIIFIILHLVGNLFLYSPSSAAFNQYAYQLDSLGTFKLVAEIGLALLILAHVFLAISLKLNHKAARPVRYQSSTPSKGGESKSNLSSRNMIITGIFLLGFIVLHIKQFRFGPKEEDGYVTTLLSKTTGTSVEAHDLHRVVVEVFQNPVNVTIYVIAMLLLGIHFRHGFWSAFQSLGATNPKLSKILHLLGLFLAVLLAAGFLFIPVYLHFVYKG